MTASLQIIVRETCISILINVSLAVAFFMTTFGLSRSVQIEVFGLGFLPQAFMTALMGALVPAVLLLWRQRKRLFPALIRALLLAGVAMIFAGGGAYAVCHALGNSHIEAWYALASTAIFGGLLAAVVTPVGVRAALLQPG